MKIEASPATPEVVIEPVPGTPVVLETPAAVEPPAPVLATPPAEEVDAGSDGIDWGQMNEDLDQDDVVVVEAREVVPTVSEVPVEEPSTEIPAPSGEVPPKVLPTEIPAAEVTPPTTPEAPKVPEVSKVPTPEAPAAETPTPGVPSQTPEQQAEAQKQVRMEQHSKLMDYYKISDEDAVSMVTSPQEVVPNMLANLHMTVLENTLQTLTSMIPQMVSQVMEQKKANTDANEAFFSAWPKLAKAELYAPLGRMISAYRNNNPEMAQDQLIKEVGAAAHLAFKIAPDNIPEVGRGEVQVPTPQVPAVAVGTFAPAAPGGSVAPVSAENTNEWTDYNKELDREDELTG